MGLFVCDGCYHLENTALGYYHSRNMDGFPKTGALCSKCIHDKIEADEIDEEFHFLDQYNGWHGQFERKLVTKEFLEEHKEHFRNSKTNAYYKILDGEIIPK